MHSISSGDENDTLSSTAEVSQLSTSTSRGAFPQKYVRERDCVFTASSKMDHEMPSHKEGWLSLQCLKCRPSFISQDEGMSESPVETLEKAIVLNFFWTEGLQSI